MPSSPSVSVLVTTYNHAAYVEEALESLRLQTTGDFEVIITDDASPDGTADVIEGWLDRTSFDATFIRNDRNRGICFNRNQALARAKGEFICSLSGDDAYQPERIERQLACFRELPADVAAVYSDMTTVDADGTDLGQPLRPLEGQDPPMGRALFRRLLIVGNFLPAPATMIRRSALDAVGPYDEELLFEDHDMWVRLAFAYDFHYLPGLLVRCRILPTSLSRSPRGLAHGRDKTAHVLTKWIGRCEDPEIEAALADRLWATGLAYVWSRDYLKGRATLSAAAPLTGSPLRRSVARLLCLPGAGAAGRASYKGYRWLHRRTT